MPKRAIGLTALKVQKAPPGRYGDGAGLYLLVRSAEARFWIFRYVRDGRMREMGLGAAAGRTAVSLVDARSKARKLYDVVREGGDPLAEVAARKAAAKATENLAVIRGKTFREVATKYIGAHESGWKNAKHRQQWENTLQTYAHPILGNLSVGEVDTGHVMLVLEPIWRDKPETASRLRGRIESVLDYARARGWRAGENPARWRGHIAEMLPARSKVRAVQHHPALPYDRIGEFMADLRSREGVDALGLEFLILTVGRTSEVTGARWPEINETEKVWTVPPERMKSKREHRVFLTAAALDVLKRAKKHRRSGDYIFPGQKAKSPLSNMAFAMLIRRMNGDSKPPAWSDFKGDAAVPHGFRSSFKDWASERTNFPNEVSEMALAHAIEDDVEAAYRRGDLFEKRRRLMEAWAKFCATVPRIGDVVSINAKGRK